MNEESITILDSIISEPLDKYRPITFDDLKHGQLNNLLLNEVSDGKLDPTCKSPFDEEYDIVNLPSQYREINLPCNEYNIHINNIYEAIDDILAKNQPNEAVQNIQEIHSHCLDIQRYIRGKESKFISKYRNIEDSITDINQLLNTLDSEIGDLAEETYSEGRQEEIKGISDLEYELSRSTELFHQCEFKMAQNKLISITEDCDVLIQNLEFLRALIGSIEHGDATIQIPQEVPISTLNQFIRILSINKEEDIFIENGTVKIATSSKEKTKKYKKSNNSFKPKNISDEILYIVRELEGCRNQDFIEKQTSELPAEICQSEVLKEFQSFCIRQSDIVSEANVQKNSPPGFLTIKFKNDIDSKKGMTKLQNRANKEYKQ